METIEEKNTSVAEDASLGEHSGAGTDSADDEDALPTRDEAYEMEKLIASETRRVHVWQTVVTVLIFIVAVVTTTGTYLFLSQEEEGDFEDTFRQYSTAVIESSRFTASSIANGMADISDQMTTLARVGNSTWPFFFFEDFQVHFGNVRNQTGAIVVWLIHFVEDEDRDSWANFSSQNIDWIPEQTRDFVFDRIHLFDEALNPIYEFGPGPFSVIFEADPTPIPLLPSFDLRFAGPGYLTNIAVLKVINEPIISNHLISDTLISSAFGDPSVQDEYAGTPLSSILNPVYDSFDIETRRMVGHVDAYLRWSIFFENLLPEGVGGIFVVLSNTCNSTRTWVLRGRQADYVGEGDRHDTAYDHLGEESIFNTYQNSDLAAELGACVYTVSVYPSGTFKDDFVTIGPPIFTALVGLVFVFMGCTFLAYNNFVTKRNKKVIDNAAKTSAIVSSMFPDEIRERLLENTVTAPTAEKRRRQFTTGKGQLKSFLSSGADLATAENDTFETKPIADLFLENTIMFGDIVGFTAWSSVREPSEIFTLLETIYSAFDRMARRRGVFKVETVGDCYVAVSGIPEPRKDHAVVMARFATACRTKLNALVKDLEVTLGPDTGELTIRIGLHSGPVTAGVLRGDRSRFQLFGETMNTTALVESTGEKDKIHISKKTADLLRGVNKGHWIVPRDEKIVSKGHGYLETFWLEMRSSYAESVMSKTSVNTSGSDGLLDVQTARWAEASLVHHGADKSGRLVDWNVEQLLGLLKLVVARRNAVRTVRGFHASDDSGIGRSNMLRLESGNTVLDEVKEIITLPKFDVQVARHEQDPEDIEIDKTVVDELFDYISTISHMYRDNAFHNFEHASHVAMSVKKLLSRIVRPSVLESFADEGDEEVYRDKVASTLHDHTYGITSDPLTQFAVVFSALIHDVDHTGVPNTQLIKENSKIAALYKNKSVAEQNSVELAWNLLFEGSYDSLLRTICADAYEQERFRQLVVNTVLATDIADKELKVLRNSRWERAFNPEASQEESNDDKVNRKATIVIEHLIQASDVAHTMQHWNIYRKWNERFFTECYGGYLAGRADKDPSTNWYKGEIGFFDFYIIPLAKKLKECGVFGVSSDEYLNYAMQNRTEWEERGKEVVAEMMEAFQNSTESEKAETSEGDAAVNEPQEETKK